jgi:hypothetical protein
MQQTMTGLRTATAVPVLACKDLVKERDFLQDKLGLTAHLTPSMAGNALVHTGSGSWLICYERPQHTPSDSTAASFLVEDLRATMHDLRTKGVHFEEYDQPGLRTENGIAQQGDTLSAWVKDPSGNILALTQPGDELRAQIDSLTSGRGSAT